MSTLKEYKAYFKPAQVPDALVKLLDFEKTQDGWFSQGFEMDGSYFSDVGLKTYSTDPAFINSFREFAQADGTGSTYAIWSESGDWENAPIVAFGSEGGVQIVAENLVELFRILGMNCMLDNWYHRLSIGQPLPTLPIWLKENWAISLDLESSYEQTCRILRIQ